MSRISEDAAEQAVDRLAIRYVLEGGMPAGRVERDIQWDPPDEGEPPGSVAWSVALRARVTGQAWLVAAPIQLASREGRKLEIR